MQDSNPPARFTTPSPTLVPVPPITAVRIFIVFPVYPGSAIGHHLGIDVESPLIHLAKYALVAVSIERKPIASSLHCTVLSRTPFHLISLLDSLDSIQAHQIVQIDGYMEMADAITTNFDRFELDCTCSRVNLSLPPLLLETVPVMP